MLIFHYRMDPWESQQPSWTRTAKVLRHHQAILDGTVTNKMNNPAPSKRRRRDKRDFINEGIDITCSLLDSVNPV